MTGGLSSLKSEWWRGAWYLRSAPTNP